MCGWSGYVFVTSPDSTTPMHLDPEHSFLLQIRGTKRIFVAGLCDPDQLVEQVANYVDGRECDFDALRAASQEFVLEPGDGVYFPSFVPHWVYTTGNETSVSFSLPFYTRFGDRAAYVHRFNTRLRAARTITAPARGLRARRQGEGFRTPLLDRTPWHNKAPAAFRVTGRRTVRSCSIWSRQPTSTRSSGRGARWPRADRGCVVLSDAGVGVGVVGDRRRACADATRVLDRRTGRARRRGRAFPAPGTTPPARRSVGAGVRKLGFRTGRRRSLRAARTARSLAGRQRMARRGDRIAVAARAQRAVGFAARPRTRGSSTPRRAHA